MPKEENIKIAIIGATSRFKGFGDNIASSAAFSASLEDVKAISEIDNEFASVYDRYPDIYSDWLQSFFFRRIIANKPCFLAIRAKKKFTAFPEQNRFYDRREYFYYDLKIGIDPISFAISLPEMIQYETKQLGQLDTFDIQTPETSAVGNFEKNIIASLLNGDTVAIRIEGKDCQDTERRLLDALGSLPLSLKKYLGFAFNIQGEGELVQNYIHVYTTLEGNTNEARSFFAGKSRDEKSDDLYEALISNSHGYDDTEIMLLSLPVNKEVLYELLRYQQLHFEVDKYLETPGDAKTSFIVQSQKYLSTFMNRRFVENSYILKRIIQIYKCWVVNDMLAPDIFIEFWNNVNIAGIRHIRLYEDKVVQRSINEFVEIEGNATMNFREIDLKYGTLSSMPSLRDPTNLSVLEEIKIRYVKGLEKSVRKDIREAIEVEAFKKMINQKAGIKFEGNAFDAIDFKQQSGHLSAEDNFELLYSKIDEFSDDKIISLINNIGLPNLYDRLQRRPEEKFLQHNNFTGPIIEQLVKNADLIGLAKWLSLFKSNHSLVSFSISGFLDQQANRINHKGDNKLFISLGRAIISYYSFFEKKDIKYFVDKVLGKKDCRGKEFYDAGFGMARTFGFTISVYSPLVRTEIELLEWVEYYGQNSQLISNPDIIAELSERVIEMFMLKPRTFQEVLLFIKSHPAFAKNMAEQFEGILENALRKSNLENREQLVLLLLNTTVVQKENLFLQSGNRLFKEVVYTEIKEQSSIKELYTIGMNIAKNNDPRFIDFKQLVDLLINTYFDKDEQYLKPFAKMKNKIAFVSKKLKNLTIILIIAVVGLSFLCFNLFLQNRSLDSRVAEMEKNNEDLNNQLKERFKQVQTPVKQDSTVTAALSPAPNRELIANDVNILNRQELKGKPVIDIVGIIFAKNPTDIPKQYHDQAAAYAAALMKLNPGCFKMDTCICMSLEHIPSYKGVQ